MIAVDSCVLIDLLGDDARAGVAEQLLRDALARGPVVACEVVVSEVVSGLGYGAVAGAALVAHPQVNKISFTGDHRTAQKIMRMIRAGGVSAGHKATITAHGGASWPTNRSTFSTTGG